MIKAREGKAVDAPKEKARPKPSALPFWTTSLDRAVERMRAGRNDLADEVMRNEPAPKAMQRLLDMAAKLEVGADRDALLARYVTMAESCDATAGERYLLLRRADELTPGNELRQKIIIDLGHTHTIQALAYIRQYYDKKPLADAVAVATRNIIAHAPQANGGRYVYNMLQAAKQSFINHYDEQGVDMAIDDVLNALDHCRTDGGYNLAFSAPTKMGKRGYWNMYDEMANFDMVFDWLAEGTLTVQIHSTPIITLDSKQGARIAGKSQWHNIGTQAPWRTAHLFVRDNKLTLVVNGHEICTDAPLQNTETQQAAPTRGIVAFNADDQGATVRQVCIKKIK